LVKTACQWSKIQHVGMLLLLLAVTATLSTGCGKKSHDSEVRSKWVILNEGREIETAGISFADSLYGWAINGISARHYLCWRTQDGGRIWVEDTLPLHSHFHDLYDLAVISKSNVWMVGTTGIILHTLDGGITWTLDDRLYDHETIPVIKEVFFPDSLHGWLGINEALGGWKIARTADGGENWEIVADAKWLLQALNGNVAFAEDTWNARILRTGDGGKTWQEIYPGIAYSRSGAKVSFIDELTGWAAINWRTEYICGGFIMATENGGATWDTVLVVDNEQFYSIHMLPTSEGWVEYGSQGILHTVDGRNWREDPLPDIGDRSVIDLFVLPGPHVWIVAGGLILSRKG